MSNNEPDSNINQQNFIGEIKKQKPSPSPKNVPKFTLEESKVLSGDLFDNPMVNSAKEALTPEMLERYKAMGEEMYNTIDFVNSEGHSETAPSAMFEAVEFILDSLRSGQHISTLEDNEKNILENVYGKKWYKKFGYKKRDLTEIVTFPNFGKV
jgi:hypothetical protein